MTDVFLIAFILLAAGVIAVPLATRFGLGSVLGYLIAGVAIGPILNALGVDVIAVQHFAEFGVVMMLFLVGLELEPPVLWSMRNRLLGLGGGQVFLTAAAIGGGALFFGLSWQLAVTVGLILALSSTAIVLQTLQEKGLMRSDGGQAGFSVLLFQDIAVIPILAFLPLLALPDAAHDGAGHEGADGHDAGLSLVEGLAGWQAGLVTLAAVAAVLVGGSYLTRPLFRMVASAGLRELFSAAALLIVIAISLLMSLVGLSPALGAFLAGVVLANSEYRHELEADIDPFRGLLLGLFFITIGAGIDFALMSENLSTILSLTVGVLVVKGAILFALARLFQVEGADKWLFSLGLAQAGEFGFVLISFALSNRLLPGEIASILQLVIAISMLATPGLFILWERVFAARGVTQQEAEADDIDQVAPVIVCGCGRMGGIIQNMIKTAGYETTVIDYNSKQLEAMRRIGFRVFFGDATRPDLLAAAGIARAKLVIVAIDNKDQITTLTRYIVENYPQVHVIARAVDRPHVFELWAAGCRDVIRETYDSSLRIARSAYEALGIPREQAERMVEVLDEADKKVTRAIAEHAKPGELWYEDEGLVRAVNRVREPATAHAARQVEEIRRGPRS
ncbi:monovalent cation:proton antiporter-2 (CPA2) family protein [Parvularcula dongshanensis]|uniref:CPA2 family monovalent cation:H+ antiporter-2 n=1 Tax=Parvularcula dongshanensis TaxID=1173995 RepID=A0A840I8V7_9PROT|nr:monovalent cation:proton antiporter-2 (CPA2) family protein [Parvularcula dongshanensis]MBB4660380.1 CPA2 family monovalent cation:H+ antiporter-2 [Parvularcula dongshanensis]